MEQEGVMSVFDEMRNDIEVLYGAGACEYHVYSDMVDYIDEAETDYTKLKNENVKLRELADAVKEFVEDTHCEDCPFRRDCDDNNRIFCADDFSYHAFAAMRELGIEV